MKKYIWLAVALLLAAVGYWYYRTLTTGPKYALVQAYRAVQNHDVTGFEKYVDVESVTNNLVDQTLQQEDLLSEMNMNSPWLRGALALAKPQLASAARAEVRRYVETGTLDASATSQPQALAKASLGGLAGKVVGPGSSFKGIQYVREQDATALVGLEFTQPKYDTTLTLELRMADRGGHWQVKELTNVSELIKLTTRLEKEYLLGRRPKRAVQ